MTLPDNQITLLRKLVQLNKKIVLVLFGGSPVELPFEDEVHAILNMYLPGQAGGEATAQLLFGEKNPSGKLAETWMKSYADVPFGEQFVQQKSELYKESIYVGYRYYDFLQGKGVRYPFGHGLSYTEFAYESLQVQQDSQTFIVTCEISNTGQMEGGEIIQVYVSNPNSDVFKPTKELRTFGKVYLKPGEKKQVKMSFTLNDLAYYHVDRKDWVVENGDYQVLIAASAADIRLSAKLSITSQPDIASPYSREQLKHYFSPHLLSQVSMEEFEVLLGRKVAKSSNKELPRYTLDSRLDELRESFIGNLFYTFVVGIGKKQFNRSQKMPEGPERDMQRKNGMFLMKMMPNNSIRSMSVSSTGRFGYHIAAGLIDLLNGRIIQGIKRMLRQERAAPLPKNQK